MVMLLVLFGNQALMANSGIAFKDIGGGEHYKSILIGGRAATMGGAFKGVSDDASGVYYNSL